MADELTPEEGMSEAKTGEQRLASVERQIRLIEMGVADSIICPYCGVIVPKGGFCCAKLTLAMSAVVDKLCTDDLIGHAEQIAERHAKN